MKDLFKNRKIKSRAKEIGIEEISLDSFLKKQKQDFEMYDKKIEVPLTKQVFLVFIFICFILFGLLWALCFHLQITQGNDYKLLSERNKFAVLKLQASRGVIYDKNLEQLVWNQSSFDLVLNISKLPEDEIKKTNIIKNVSDIIGSEVDLNADKGIITRNLSYRALISLQAEPEKFPGFEIRENSIRRYEESCDLAHVLGYMGKIKTSELEECENCSILDYVGREGLEKSYENILKERKGEIQIEKTVQGKEISRKIIKYPESGNSLVLNLDFSLQKKVDEELREAMEKVGSEKGAVVALDPRNGNILALISLPTFNNNLFAQGISQEEFDNLNQDKRNPQINRAISGLYPTGSAIKPLIASAALEEGIIKENTQLYCPLNLCLENIYSKEKECFVDWKFHGLSDIKRALAESINPFFYIIGGGYIRPSFADLRLPKHFIGLGVDKIKEYLEKFGLGQKTGIDLPGEVQGRVPDAEWKEKYFANQARAQQIWYLGDTYNLSIGQGYFLATPIQIASAFSAIANNGTLYKPKLVDRVINSEKELVEEINPEIISNNFIKQENLDIVRQGMRQSVSLPSGSAFSLNSLPVEVATKTGTAQIGSKEIYEEWVGTFAPYQNPEIVLVVLIEEVPGMQRASLKASKEILNWYFDQEIENINEE